MLRKNTNKFIKEKGKQHENSDDGGEKRESVSLAHITWFMNTN